MRKQLLFGFFALALATMACAINLSSAKIKDAWTASNEAGDQRSTTFEQDKTVYVKVELGNAPDDTKVKATFSTVDVEGDEDNKLIDDHELTGGSGTLTFTLSNTKLWPVGKYKVELYLNGQLERTLEYEVKALPATPTVAAPTPQPTTESSAARITRAFMARDENGDEAVNRFQPTEVVYTIFDLEAAQGVHMKAVWIAKDAQGLALDTVLEEYPFEKEGSGRNWVSYTPDPDDPWKPGRYQVQLYVNDLLSQTLDFTIEEASQSSGAGSITSAFMSYDQGGVSPTTVFGRNDVFYCIVGYSTNGLVSLRAEWYQDDTQAAQNTFIDSFTVDVSGTSSTWFSLSGGNWSPGDYRLDLYVNDEYSTSVYFEVR